MKIKLLFLITFLFACPYAAQAANVMPRGFSADQDFKINFQDQVFEFTQEQINQSRGSYVLPAKVNLLYSAPSRQDLENEFFGKTTPSQKPGSSFLYNPSVVYKFITNIENAVEKNPTEPKLTIENNRAVDFAPPEDGVYVDGVKTTLEVLSALENYQTSFDLPFSTTSPKNLLSATNSVGINELIARGVSNFKGSPKNRRHNIKVGVEKFTGLIIKQGEEFSFNKYLGPVEKEQGFLPELVIKKSGTVPELGGGLCQVSSTTFRAAMDAGLPITQRRNHAYAVQYYSPQGTDATIYPGVVDLKFKNDTPGEILVWPHFEDTDVLIFDFYGTKDNRVVELKKPTQYDRKPDGSMKAEWVRIVTKDGVTSTSTFKSVYQSPALFHKEEKFVTAAPTPTPTPPAQTTQVN